jgi:protein-tyrosine phosphatase
MMKAEVYERRIGLSGCGNFRDIGGYEARDGRKVRWRRVFRSDALIWLTAEDVQCLHDMGIKLVAGLDLRTPEELEQMHRGLLYDNGTRHHHLPFIPTFGDDRERMRAVAYAIGQVASKGYLELLEQSRPCFEGLFDILADDAMFPAAYYCAAGKDRTGMVTAVLLRVLGVADEQIIEDYALTSAPTEERIIARLTALGREPAETLANRASMAAHPETMEHFLSDFDREHGSAEAFLLSCNVSEEAIEQVREHLLEP